jgi:alkylation response protein AidB-like acyl-CoA dehydrogenase
MNNLFFTESHKQLKENLVKFLTKNIDPIKDSINANNKVPTSLIQEIGKEGYIGPLIPAEYNGTEAGLIAHCLITEEISKRNVAISVSRTPCILDGYLLNKYGNKQQKEKFLTKIARGEKICSICVTEEGAGSNVAGINTRAKKSGDRFILNGSKKFITNVGIADYYFVWAITDENVNPRNGMSVFLIEKDTPGLETEISYGLMGIQGIWNGIINMKDVEVSSENLIGNQGSAYQSLMDTFNIERLTLSSECNGISIAALKAAKSYAKEHLQFNRPLSSFQLTKIKIAEMITKLRAARLLTYSAAKLAESNLNITKEASMAKSFSSKSALEITSNAVQIHGGNGYTDNFKVERYMRDARFFQIGGGTTEIQDLIIAREELKEK